MQTERLDAEFLAEEARSWNAVWTAVAFAAWTAGGMVTRVASVRLLLETFGGDAAGLVATLRRASSAGVLAWVVARYGHIYIFKNHEW